MGKFKAPAKINMQTSLTCILLHNVLFFIVFITYEYLIIICFPNTEYFILSFIVLFF